MRYKKTIITTAILASFFLGTILPGQIKNIKKYSCYEPAKGYYERPCNLEIKTNKNIEGKIETYLCDTETKQCQKIGTKMYVGDYKHRIKAVCNIPKEILEDKKNLGFILNLYDFILDDD